MSDSQLVGNEKKGYFDNFKNNFFNRAPDPALYIVSCTDKTRVYLQILVLGYNKLFGIYHERLRTPNGPGRYPTGVHLRLQIIHLLVYKTCTLNFKDYIKSEKKYLLKVALIKSIVLLWNLAYIYYE